MGATSLVKVTADSLTAGSLVKVAALISLDLALVVLAVKAVRIDVTKTTVRRTPNLSRRLFMALPFPPLARPTAGSVDDWCDDTRRAFRNSIMRDSFPVAPLST
jgi:hypothetical protein